MKRYFAEQLFDGDALLSQVLLEVDAGQITTMRPASQPADAELLQGLVVPGFVDVQVNGGGGVQFNNTPTVAALQTMAKAHLHYGTTSLMPTLITDEWAVMNAAADAVAELRQQGPSAVVGIHFEGPHLSLAKKGMHHATALRPIGAPEIALFCRQDLGQVMVTLAPETVDSDTIRHLVAQGVIVSLGHSNATAEQCLEAFAAGARGVTHLYNAMSQLVSRAPGVVGAALATPQVYCGLIVDHLHVHPLSSKVAIAAKGPQRLMLITDAMASVGSDIDHFYYQGHKVFCRGKQLTLADGTIAGSALTMLDAVCNTHQDLHIPLLDTLKMATATPAAFLGLSQRVGALKLGMAANMLLLDAQLKIHRRWLWGAESA